MLLLFSNLLLLLLSLLSDSNDNGVVDGEGGDVPFCVIAVVDVVFDNVVFVCVFDVAVNCSFNVLTSFSASVALCVKTYKKRKKCMLDQNYKLLQSNKSCIKQLIQFLAWCQESEKKSCVLFSLHAMSLVVVMKVFLLCLCG